HRTNAPCRWRHGDVIRDELLPVQKPTCRFALPCEPGRCRLPKNRFHIPRRFRVWGIFFLEGQTTQRNEVPLPLEAGYGISPYSGWDTGALPFFPEQETAMPDCFPNSFARHRRRPNDRKYWEKCLFGFG